MSKYHDEISRKATIRRAKFKALKDKGRTLQEIGDMHGLTGERVRQILNPGKRP